jgi:parallel beta-helix repeat protein
VFMKGSNVEIAQLQLDGNYDNQDTIDQCFGIYNPSGGYGSKIHHNYVHHTKGSGIKLRGSNIEVYENLIEWTENPCVELAYSPSFIHVHHNTLKYTFNDDNIRISDAHDITIEYNEFYGVTSALLASGDSSIPIVWRNKQPDAWNGIRADRNSYNILIQRNKIYDVSGYGISQCYGHDNTIQHNQIYNSEENQLSVQNWGGNCYNIHVIGNLAVGGAVKGLDIDGSNNEIRDNWTKDNANGGISISGSGHYGSGNYPEETTNDAPASFISSTPPSLPTFQAGTTW